MRIDRATGKEMSEIDHIRQSIQDVLTTPVGSRLGNREYGCNHLAFVDAGLSNHTFIDFFAEIGRALSKWEKRFAVKKVRIVKIDPSGRVEIALEGILRLTQMPTTLEGFVV